MRAQNRALMYSTYDLMYSTYAWMFVVLVHIQHDSLYEPLNFVSTGALYYTNIELMHIYIVTLICAIYHRLIDVVLSMQLLFEIFSVRLALQAAQQ